MRTFPLLIPAVALAAGLALAGCGQNNGGNANNGQNSSGQTAGEQAQASVNQAGNDASNAAGQVATATSDTAITAAVKSKLLANSSTSGMDIHVETNSGVVTLSGNVRSDAEKELAERIARNTNGVTDVTNNLKVNS